MSISKLLKMNYNECCNYLLDKYGSVKGNYFTNKNCKIRNASISRTKDGLYIHHIDEDKAILLSTYEHAIKNPFDFQKADRLVYCNLLEHLVLHIKIMQYPSEDKNENEDVGIGGVFNFFIPELNDIYSGIIYKQEWKENTRKSIINNKKDYYKCIEFLMENFKQIGLNWYLTSFNHGYGIWKIKNNCAVFKDIKKIYFRKNNLSINLK